MFIWIPFPHFEPRWGCTIQDFSLYLRSSHMVLTVGIIIHAQPHVDRAFPHLWAILKDKLILLSALDGQELWKWRKSVWSSIVRKQIERNTNQTFQCVHKKMKLNECITFYKYQIPGTEFWLCRRCSFWCCPPVRGQSGNIGPGKAPRYESLQDNLVK